LEAERDIPDGVREIADWILDERITDYSQERYRNSEYQYM
jgi:hypothetical protein